MLVADFYSASAMPEGHKIIGSIERDMCVCVCVCVFICLYTYVCMHVCAWLLLKVLQTIMHKS